MARQGNVRTVTILLAGTATLFLGGRRNRVGLLLFPSKTVSGDYTISNDPSVTAGGGIYVPTTSVPVFLDAAQVGDLLQQPLYAIVGVNGTVIPIVESVESD